jgi:hypothetical protein
VAQPNLTFDGTYLTIGGTIILNSSTATASTGNTTVATFSNSLGNASFFDYHVFASYGPGSRRRAGTVMCVWDNDVSAVRFTDTSTPDLGFPTSDIVLSVQNSSGVIGLVATVANGTWTIKTGIRII